MPQFKLRSCIVQTAATAVSVLLISCSAEKNPPPGTDTSAGEEKILVCPRSGGPIAVDGKIEDAWSWAGRLMLDDPADVADPNAVRIYTVWDENYLYVAYEVVDMYLVGYQTERDHKTLYRDDMIEVLLDPRQDRTDLWLDDDIVYHVNLLGQVKDDRGTPGGRPQDSDATWNSRALFAAVFDGTLNDSSDTDRGFCVELAVPWSEIGKSPDTGVKLGINFASGDAEGPEEHLWDWCGAHPFRQPSVYGTLVLTDK